MKRPNDEGVYDDNIVGSKAGGDIHVFIFYMYVVCVFLHNIEHYGPLFRPERTTKERLVRQSCSTV